MDAEPKRQITLRLDAGLLDRIEDWRESQPVPPTRTACIEQAFRLWLDAVETAGAKPGKAVRRK
jgi:hypothetical protein